MEGLFINPEKSKQVAVILFEKFNSDEGIFGHNVMPEDLRPKLGSNLSASNVEKGSYENLMFITLVVSIDYQRNADQLWEAGRRTFEDERTRWLFYPNEVIKKSSMIVEAMKAHRLSEKPKKDAGIWFKVSKSLFEVYDSNPKSLIRECNDDALIIFNKKFDLRFKKLFPYLSGDKIFPLWIRMLHDNVGIDLKNLGKIPIPVDVHIARATFTTGCLTGKYKGTISHVKDKIDEAWKRTLEFVQHPKLAYRLQLDEPLWHLSKYGCTSRTRNFCPKRRACPVSQFCANGLVNVSATEVEIDTGESNEKASLGNFMFK